MNVEGTPVGWASLEVVALHVEIPSAYGLTTKSVE